MTYAEAVRQIVAEYKQRITDYRQAELDLLTSNAQFRESEQKVRDMQLRQAMGEKIERSTLDEVLAQNKKIRQKLRLAPPAPRCKLCGDTGRKDGKFCDCAVARAIASHAQEVAIPLHKFEEVDYTVYGENAEQYRKLFGYVDKICSTYPNNKKRCLVISGTTGNGKTYLAGCAAQKMLERGASVMALTAFAANDRFLKYHTCFNDGKADYLDPMLDCTLLIIDDLGTESILKNVTIEYLYQVVNERNTAGKLTLITTNLTPERLNARYGERIYSRLFDKALSLSVFLQAKDIRSGL